MPNLPLPGPIQRRNWQYRDATVYLPPNQIGSSAGRITPLIYDRAGDPVRRHPEYGYPVHRYYFLAEVKLMGQASSIDIWQVVDFDRQNERGDASVKLEFLTTLRGGSFDPEPNWEQSDKYRKICNYALDAVAPT